MIEIIFDKNIESKLKKWKVSEGSKVLKQTVLFEFGDEEIEKFRSSHTGIISKLCIKEFDTIKPGLVVALLSQCEHRTSWRNMCADCGMDLKNLEKNCFSSFLPVEHAIPDLLVSEERAKKMGTEDKERLLKRKQLVLLVDLDHTVLHTSDKKIHSNQDLFYFDIPTTAHSPPSSYHTKFRPHLRTFLERISKLFELHIFTFGVRPYAYAIAQHLDPDKKFFQQRILTRNECFHPLLKSFNLKSLFPCGDDLVCIIDDREDVWQSAENLIRVKPFVHFRDSWDFNNQKKIISRESKNNLNSFKSGAGDACLEQEVLKENSSPNCKDEKNQHVSSEKVSIGQEGSNNEDDYLLFLENILTRVHKNFFLSYELSGFSKLPTLKEIIPEERKKTFENCFFVFSGVIPLNVSMEKSLVFKVSKNFGAQLEFEITNKTTHVIASKHGTSKIKEAIKRKINVVSLNWFVDSVDQWKKQDETLYPLEKSMILEEFEQNVRRMCDKNYKNKTSNFSKEIEISNKRIKLIEPEIQDESEFTQTLINDIENAFDELTEEN